MPLQGFLTILLHAHLPFVRHPDHPEFLEEDWLYEAITECYVPLLRVLERLADEGVAFRLAMTLTPTLCEMLEDPLLQERASARLGRLSELAAALEIEQVGTPFSAAIQHQAAELREVRRLYDEVYQRRLVPALRVHQDAGRLEIVASAATHAVLPLLATDTGRAAQIRAGMRSYERHFGRPARGIWLPECAYTPGLDALLGVRWTVLETHGLTGATPPARYGVGRPVVTPGGVAVFGRDPASSEEVWSAEAGYPGHPHYREFYRDAGYDLPYEQVRACLNDGARRSIGLKLHRVTGKVPLGDKEPWEPAVAAAQASAHARDFVDRRVAAATRLKGAFGVPPHLMAPYDAELFGHWWAEGPAFLEAALRRLAAQDELRLVTPSEYLELAPVHQEVVPALSSWGDGGYFAVWLNPANDWIYRHLHRAEERMIALSRRYARAAGLYRRALAQAGRELLLAQASDWPFILTMKTSPSYASRRVREHLVRFHELASALEAGRVDEAALEKASALDNLFPELDGSEWIPATSRGAEV